MDRIPQSLGVRVVSCAPRAYRVFMECEICKLRIRWSSFNWKSEVFQRMLKGEDHLNKRQYAHITANTTVTVTFTSITTIPIATTCRAKSTEMKISRSI